MIHGLIGYAIGVGVGYLTWGLPLRKLKRVVLSEVDKMRAVIRR